LLLLLFVVSAISFSTCGWSRIVVIGATKITAGPEISCDLGGMTDATGRPKFREYFQSVRARVGDFRVAPKRIAIATRAPQLEKAFVKLAMQLMPEWVKTTSI